MFPKIDYYALFNGSTIRTLQPIRKGSGEEQTEEPQRKGQDTVSFVFCSNMETNCLHSR